MKRLAIILATTGMFAVAGAYAQVTSPSNPPASAPAPGATQPRPAAVAPAQSKEMAQILASDVLKSNVYDPQENKIGTIDDVLMARDGSPEQAIIGVGGFLGIGEKDVAVPFADLKMKSRDGKNWFELARTKDQLKSATAFDTKKHKAM